MKPKILHCAVSQTTALNEPTFEYDFSLSLNTVIIRGEKRPFIDTNTNDVSLITRTSVQGERDDHSPDLVYTGTRTKTARESDYHSSLLELSTKTRTARESDD